MSKQTRIMRISAENYARITELRTGYGRRHKIKRVTYDMILDELVRVAEALASGEEIYLVGDRAYEDLPEARGEALMKAVRERRPPNLPIVCVKLGEDQGLLQHET